MAKNRSKYLNLTDETSVPHAAIEGTIEDILLVAEKELGKSTKDLTVLDIGSGFGLYSQELAKFVKKVVGVEPFKGAYEKAIRMNRRSNVKFVNSLIEDYKGKEKFDLAISLTTLEHMPHQEKSFKNVFRIMKPGAILYVTAPNKLWPIEPHYELPFLSWLPLSLANLYLKITGRGESYQESSYSRTYFGMRRLFDNFNCDYYFPVPAPNAIYIGCGRRTGMNTLLKHGGIWLIKKAPLFWLLSKGFIMVVKKK
ncbi:MAG: hypothetical protein A3C30_00550 [Candidatus Levybacteria bacterium RIFCSPHIGHO2_02_FULL_40_18]|nr:MAG: hypothetical protein A2869_03380 [Candidatus Levybacteria bacterium RIFCSPHIGHO2_01_FULL_40_58]OGH27190.1 MAG: hypothetical protein A3C30_00550 [Candidatus Levybacteria bacterium RIFCSPHIGHO2_02_FULL_40_18]OGH31049.1 MAG: hypothetical protein A3E43_04965 [Candidatus Levybacteria bacterium RIFCSPHIGHO2_12_FULL_40_31]OGH40783.1 MAG: hypothetical protein A2894_03475 [Candidatus Levybacteria bacterium RIFCSPLOWO2_01_FULL_40_64]OGH49421.1 MAG: hypothetical protein A3I54_02115 [Candidatus Lev